MDFAATLAQLVEQRFRKAKVPSSTLGGGSKISLYQQVARSTHSINTQVFDSEVAQTRGGRTEWDRSTTTLRALL